MSEILGKDVQIAIKIGDLIYIMDQAYITGYEIEVSHNFYNVHSKFDPMDEPPKQIRLQDDVNMTLHLCGHNIMATHADQDTPNEIMAIKKEEVELLIEGEVVTDD